jgi:ribosome-binding factor A
MSIQDERVKDQLKQLAAKFLSLEGNMSSLITITQVVMSKDRKSATIFFTVFPEQFEKTALEFAKRKRSEFKHYVKENVRFGKIPFIEFAIDAGEKNRQRIDEISSETAQDTTTSTLE